MAASNSESLLHLLTQCKSMERHLTSILMECLLKLSSATSTGVFLLVEDGVDGMRRIAGSSKLSDAFKACALIPTGEEMELFLDDPNPSVDERPIRATPPLANLFGMSSDLNNAAVAASTYFESSAGAGDVRNGIQRLSRKRLSDGFQSGSGTGSNRSKHFKRACKPTFLPSQQQQQHQHQPLGSSSSADVVEIKDEVHDYYHNDSPENLTVSLDDSPGLVSTDGDHEAGESPSVVPLSVNNGVETGGGGGGGAVAIGGSNFDGDYSRMRNPFQSVTNFGQVENPSNDASKDSGRNAHSSNNGKSTLNNDFGFDVEKFLMENDKYRAVANIRDSAIMEKSNIANKLLTSLLYDISKSIVIHSPYRENKNKQNSEYFNQVFETVWEHLPYLNELNDTRAKFNGKSPRYYVRHTMQAYYIVLMSKCVNQAQNQTAGYRAIRFLD